MILCHCKVVADRDVQTAVTHGARTVSAVCKATGAGRDCGACVFSLKAVICEHDASETGLLEVDGAAS